MKAIKSLLNYFIRGFQLLNKEIIIYLIIVLFILINLLISFFSAKIKILSIFTSLLIFFKWAYSISIPLFVNKYIDEKKIKIDYIADTTLGTSKRLIIPGIILSILFTVVVILWIGWLVTSNGGNVARVQTIMSSFYTYNPVSLLEAIPSILLFSLFTFQSVFFVIKKRGFFISFLDSLIFSVKNWQFIILVTFFHFLVRLIVPVFYPSTVSALTHANLIQRILFQIPSFITEYVGVIITVSSVLYFLGSSRRGND